MAVAAVAGDTRDQFSDVFAVYVQVAIAVLLLVAATGASRPTWFSTS